MSKGYGLCSVANGKVIKMSIGWFALRDKPFDFGSNLWCRRDCNKKVWTLKKNRTTCVRADVMTNEFRVERDLSRYAFNEITSSSDHLSILSLFSPINKRSLHKFLLALNLLIRSLLNNWIKISEVACCDDSATWVEELCPSICNYDEINFESFLCCRIALIGVFMSDAETARRQHLESMNFFLSIRCDLKSGRTFKFNTFREDAPVGR